MRDERKARDGFMAAILTVCTCKSPMICLDDRREVPEGTKLIEASIQWAERIIEADYCQVGELKLH
jgi:hypothetical protein